MSRSIYNLLIPLTNALMPRWAAFYGGSGLTSCPPKSLYSTGLPSSIKEE